MKTGISAIVTAYERIDQTLATLRVIQSCLPKPDEILVHVDADQVECEEAIRSAFPDVQILRSSEQWVLAADVTSCCMLRGLNL